MAYIQLGVFSIALIFLVISLIGQLLNLSDINSVAYKKAIIRLYYGLGFVALGSILVIWSKL